MSKGIIKADHGKGRYTVEIQVQQGYTNNMLARLQAKIDLMDQRIAEAKIVLKDYWYEIQDS